MSARKHLDLTMVAKLLGPLEPAIRLVPQESIKKSEEALRWGVLFLSIAAITLGGCLSLFMLRYSNSPVLILLIVFQIVFDILAFLFFKMWWKERNMAFYQAIITRGRTYMGTKIQSELGMIGLKYKVHLFLKSEVFNEALALSIGEFQERLEQLTSNELPPDIVDKIVESLINSNIIQRVDISDPNSGIRLNPEWTPSLESPDEENIDVEDLETDVES